MAIMSTAIPSSVPNKITSQFKLESVCGAGARKKLFQSIETLKLIFQKDE